MSELLKEATKQDATPKPSFDASIAYLQYPLPKASFLEREKMVL
jgi:hypothetical protein